MESSNLLFVDDLASFDEVRAGPKKFGNIVAILSEFNTSKYESTFP